jgi:hypothetical protein
MPISCASPEEQHRHDDGREQPGGISLVGADNSAARRNYERRVGRSIARYDRSSNAVRTLSDTAHLHLPASHLVAEGFEAAV